MVAISEDSCPIGSASRWISHNRFIIAISLLTLLLLLLKVGILKVQQIINFSLIIGFLLCAIIILSGLIRIKPAFLIPLIENPFTKLLIQNFPLLLVLFVIFVLILLSFQAPPEQVIEEVIQNKIVVLCKTLKTQKERDECFYRFALEHTTIAYCFNWYIKNDTIADVCFYDVAQLKNNPDICYNINSNNLQDACFANIAKLRKDVSLCSSIKSNATFDLCYIGVAVATKNATLCNRTLEKDICYKEVGSAIVSADVCYLIKENRTKAECLLSIAIKTNDFNICENITDKQLKKSCMYHANQTKNLYQRNH